MKSNEELRLSLGDWQWNAAIMGFINIVGKENVHCTEDAIEFSRELLDGFEEKFFRYFINTYAKTLSWHRIVSYEDRLEAYENSDFEEFNLQALKNLNTYIRDVKRFLKSNSYKAAYDLIDSDRDMLSLEKTLAVVKEPKNQQQFEEDKSKIIEQVKAAFELLRQAIDYCNSPGGKRYIRAKNVIYTVIKNAWDGVSFLNPQTKEKDVYADYKACFVDGVVNYLNQDKSKYRFKCFVCEAPIKDMNQDLSFLNATGFDVARKSSHVWNFQNDIAICPLCKLIYSCLPAGLTYVFDRGIYVNANMSVEAAWSTNYRIRRDVLDLKEGLSRSLYPSLIRALYQTENNAVKYEFADIQVVRYERESYRFNILSRKMLEIVMEAREELDSLIKTLFIENGENVRIYDEVINRIFNNQNLFTLIHRMLYHWLADSGKCYFNATHVIYVLKINQQIYQRLGGMRMSKEEGNRQNTSLIGASKSAGRNLKKGYNNKDAGHKLPGICHHLLNALKTDNKNMFLNVALNCYLYIKTPVPDVITDAMGDQKEFDTMGYAFVAGLIDSPDDKRNAAVKNEEE